MRFLLYLTFLAWAAVAQTTGRIEGRVVTGDGSPVPRATVRIQGVGGVGGVVGGGVAQVVAPTVYIEVTDKNGAFGADVPAGMYLPTAMRPGYQFSTGAAPATPVYVTAGKTASTEIRLSVLGSVSGFVVDADGDPLAGVQVSLMRTNYSLGRANLNQVSGGITDDQGQFRLANAQPGRYYVQATLNVPNFGQGVGNEVRGASAQTAELPTFYPSSADVANATAINLQTQPITGLRLTMRRGRTYQVQGTLAPLPSGPQRPSVSISSKGSNNIANISVAANGEFTLRGLVPGEYILTARLNDPTGSNILGRADLKVKDADLTNVSVRLIAPQELAGNLKVEGVPDVGSFLAGLNATHPNVLGPGGQQVARGPMITLMPVEAFPGSYPQLMVAPDGSFRAPAVAAGGYLLNIGNLGPGMFLKQARLDGQDITGKRLELGEGKHTLELLLSTAGATMTYQTSRSSPMVIWPVVPDLLTVGGGVLLVSGSGTQANVAPGEYFAALWEELPAADLARAPDFLRRFDDLATRVSLQPGTTTPVQPKVIPRDALQKVMAEF